MTEQDLQAMIDKMADELVEHVESVVILIDIEKADGNQMRFANRGSYYAAVGMLDHFKACWIAERVAAEIKAQD